MEVISNSKGFILKFESWEDFDNTLFSLYKMLEYIEDNNIEPPFVYATFDERIDGEEIDNYLMYLKGIYRKEENDKSDSD